MATTTEIRRYQSKDLNKSQQQELEGYLSFTNTFLDFQEKVTEQTFIEIFGDEGHRLWVLFVDRLERDIVVFVFEKFLKHDQVTQLFYYLIEGQILIEIPKQLEASIGSKLRGSYGFIYEIIFFGNYCKPTTFTFLFGNEGETLWTRFRKDCNTNPMKFVFGSYLSPDQKSILFCNVMMHTSEMRFENFMSNSVNMLRAV